MRVIAVDWSGAKTGSRVRTKLWHAEAIDGRLVQIMAWASRDELVSCLIDLAAREPELAVGLDFAFSAPRWFLESRGLMSVTELWQLASREAESWLAACEPPFWGRVRGSRPEMPSYLRVADRLSVAGISPKSVFQIGGPGQVGTGSLRGWPQLQRLRNGGFTVWPFDVASMPLVVEIYPRLMTGPVRKSSAVARQAYLDANCPSLTSEQVCIAASCEDAFDATVAALVMARHEAEFARLPKVNDRTSLLEGLIWKPQAL
jgi:hypothetical protein